MTSTRSRHRLAVLAAAMLVVGGCSTPGAAGPSPAAPSGAAGPDATGSAPSAQLAAALLPVTPVPTDGGAVSGLLEPGSPLVLDATGPDGATFHAEFPAGAATSSVTITMQPLQSVGGLTGAVEAVSFEPSGLLLVKPAVLTIDGPVANALTARAFGYQDTGAGNVARPVITASAAGPLRLVIGHFSGYGAAADDPPPWTITTITATEANDIIELEDFVLANAYRAKRSGTLSEAEADQVISNALDAIATASQRLGDAAVKAAEQGSVTPAAQAEITAAIQVILESARADQLLGRPGDPAAMEKVTKIIDAYLVGVTKHCTDTHDLTSLSLLLGLARQAQLLHGDTSGQAEISRCTAAKVHFQTTITAHTNDPNAGGTYGGTVGIDVSVPIDLFDGIPSPTVPITVSSTLVGSDSTCTITISIADSNFTVVRATLKQAPPKPSPSGKPTGAIPLLSFTDATVVLSIGALGERIEESGSCGPNGTPGDFIEVLDKLWNEGFNSQGTFTFDGGFEIPGEGSAVLARRTIDKTVFMAGPHSESYSSTTLIEIIHAP